MQLGGFVLVGVEPGSEAGLVDSLGVVVLIPEQRQQHHRLAEVKALGDRVVAAVGDHELDLRQDRGLGQELLADHVRRQLELGVLRSHRDDHPVRGVGERADQAAHQLDVGGAKRAEAEVDQRLVARGERLGQRPVGVGGADA